MRMSDKNRFFWNRTDSRYYTSASTFDKYKAVVDPLLFGDGVSGTVMQRSDNAVDGWETVAVQKFDTIEQAQQWCQADIERRVATGDAARPQEFYVVELLDNRGVFGARVGETTVGDATMLSCEILSPNKADSDRGYIFNTQRAIYAMTPCSEDEARAFNKRCNGSGALTFARSGLSDAMKDTVDAILARTKTAERIEELASLVPERSGGDGEDSQQRTESMDNKIRYAVTDSDDSGYFRVDGVHFFSSIAEVAQDAKSRGITDAEAISVVHADRVRVSAPNIEDDVAASLDEIDSDYRSDMVLEMADAIKVAQDALDAAFAKINQRGIWMASDREFSADRVQRALHDAWGDS